jgi:hypothetical protein
MNREFKDKFVLIALCTVIALLIVAAGLLWLTGPETPNEDRSEIIAVTLGIGAAVASCLCELREIR